MPASSYRSSQAFSLAPANSRVCVVTVWPGATVAAAKRVIGLVTATRTPAEFAVHCALRHQGRQPIFLGETEPAAGVVEGFLRPLV